MRELNFCIFRSITEDCTFPRPHIIKTVPELIARADTDKVSNFDWISLEGEFQSFCL